jgi:hypothetical protein
MQPFNISRSTVSVFGWVFFLSLFIMSPMAAAQEECSVFGDPDLNLCGNNCEFTTDFRLEDCKFKARGANPFFILKPGYRVVLESDEEMFVETVLCETKKIKLDGRRIRTRVVEERALEWDEEDEGWVTIEISRNYFAICKKTNAVYYFGELSRDCPDGFNDNDICKGEESNEGSWEAGVNGALPGLIMPGTPLLGAKYFQELAPFDTAVDRGEVVATGRAWDDWSGCIEIHDTNPTEEDGCGDEDVKIYCPGVGLVQDQELELVSQGFVGCDPHDDDDDDDDDDKDYD